MTKKINNFNVVLFSGFLILLHLPFVFAKSIPKEIPVTNSAVSIGNIIEVSLAKSTIKKEYAQYLVIYEDLNLSTLGMSKDAFNNAVRGWSHLVAEGKISNESIISIVDFTLPSNKKRLFIVDLENHKLLFNTYVSHGRNSGQLFAKDFSNQPESYKSSLGFYVTQGTYNGKHGYSLKLSGEDKGFNDNANARAIVMHSAPYADENVVKSQGYLGRSLGCPALPPSVYKPIIEKIKNGSCLFLYSPDQKYLATSKLLRA